MTREIKFRAWDKEEKKMFYPMGITNPQNSNGVNMIFMQFTGLKDKNRKEIFEGDIVKLGSNTSTFVIVYYEDGFSLKDTRYLKDEYPSDIKFGLNVYRKRIEVIGNKFENPELLEEKP